MSSEKDLVIFSICGQEFRIRANKEEADRIERVAESVRQRINQNRQRGGTSDFRASLMAAYELAYEHEILDEKARLAHNHAKTIDTARSAMDRLLMKLEEELAAPWPPEEEKAAIVEEGMVFQEAPQEEAEAEPEEPEKSEESEEGEGSDLPDESDESDENKEADDKSPNIQLDLMDDSHFQ